MSRKILKMNRISNPTKFLLNCLGALVATAVMLLSPNRSFAQPTPTGASCADAIPFCTGTTYVFPNSTNATPAPGGLGYQCLASQPNPIWYYMKIANPGTLQITVNQYNAAMNGLDVDFAMWGPFNSLAEACVMINAGTPAIQSSYSAASTETVGIGLPGGVGAGVGCATTPPAALTGQYYVLLLTNFSNQPGTFQFSQTAGTATTDCSIITCGVTLSSNSPICAGDTMRLFVDNTNEPEYTYSYIWEGTNGFTSTDKEPVIPNLAPGNYHYQVYAIAHLANNEYDTCIEEIDVVVNPVFETVIDEYICSGDSFFWYDHYVSTAGTYDSLFHTVTGCDSLVRTNLHVIQRPERIDMLDSIIACQYDSVPLESNTLPYNPGYTYNWSPGTNLSATNQPNVWFAADASRTYILTVTNTEDGISCSLKDTIDVIVNPGDFLQVPITDTGICPTETVQIIASGAHTYEWSPSTYLDDAYSSSPKATPHTSTLYTLIGTSEKGCTDTQTVMITVHPGATMELPDFVNIYQGEAYQFTPLTNASFFKWFPDAGLSNTEIANPKLTATVDTRYFVTARTEHGCEATDSIDVWVKETVMDMPNAFNPNQTQFKAEMRGIARLESFEIYNRWGQKVFETQNIEQGWDGYLNGVPQPMGVYIYKIEATTIEGKAFKKTGNVTLVR